jgi:6-phospho-3-hexuloisomerase
MSTVEDASRYILTCVEKMLRQGQEEAMGDVVDTVVKAKKIFVYGVGRSGLVGKAFAMRLVQLGLRVFFIGETITPIVERGDAVVIVSRTGGTMSAVQTANIARRVGATVVSVTASKASKLGQASNIVLWVPDPRGEDTAKYAPLGTLFETAVLILLDGIVADVMDRLGESEASMRQRHAIMV